MFHYKLIELEAELLAKKQSQHGLDRPTPACMGLLDYLEREVGVKLGQTVPKDFGGWITWRRNQQSLIICRGRAFKVPESRAGLDVTNGADSIAEFRRGFDVSPPQDLDHLLINFGGEHSDPSVFLWYGENFAPYKLIFTAPVDTDPHIKLSEAVVECLTWVMKRPKDETLAEFLKKLK
jgi:hypothetical protein